MSFSKNEYAILVARAWSDYEFAELLRNRPNDALTELGLSPADNVTIKFLFDDVNTAHVIIPMRPDGLSNEDLEAAKRGAPEILGPTPVAVCPGPPSKHIC